MSQSILYKRAVGYFRSSIYHVAGLAIIDFARRGGKIKLVCSPELNEDDLAAISLGYAQRKEAVSKQLISEIDRLLAETKTNYLVRILATLVAINALEIRIAIRSHSQGIYHEKIGVFVDEFNNCVSFIGSANESWSGWHSQGNFESIEVFCSWRHEIEEVRAARHQHNFDNLWAGNTPGIQTLEFPDAVHHYLCKQAYESLGDAESTFRSQQSPKPTQHSSKRQPLPHQISAIESWHNQGCRGIFEHATGSGKTFTALEAARSHVNNNLPVLILVPSRILLEQWNEEVQTEFPEAVVVLVGAGYNQWKKPGRMRRLSVSHAVGQRIIIATMQTAATDYFRQNLSQGSHLMLIADEVHQIGSPYNSLCLQIVAGHRLGLSATPKRYGDPEGTVRLFNYFGPVVPPPITLFDAVNSGRLVEYEYHPHSIHLSPDESESWKAYTRQIGVEILKLRKTEGEIRLSDHIKMLLIQRSRIAKKACGKPLLAVEVIKKWFKEGQSWLIYCEDIEQLRETIQLLKFEGVKPIEYHTGMEGDRYATLDWFRKFGGILVSIKCLDEGVDIPNVSHALILASSQNPRQFIQRRGRVLRKAPGKNLAVIHDAIVVPLSIDDEPEQLSLLKSELLRAIEFSNSALNKSASAELRQIAYQIGFDPEESGDIGIEEEES